LAKAVGGLYVVNHMGSNFDSQVKPALKEFLNKYYPFPIHSDFVVNRVCNRLHFGLWKTSLIDSLKLPRTLREKSNRKIGSNHTFQKLIIKNLLISKYFEDKNSSFE
jgi:hypothetical protein